MRMYRAFLATFLFVGLLASQGRADWLVDIQGTAISGSTFFSNTGPNVDLSGQSFDVQAVIPNTPYNSATGLGYYTPSSITVMVDNGMTTTTYTASNPGNGLVILADPTYAPLPYYIIGISGDIYTFFSYYSCPSL
jgi:hypothetical protein